ncbi:hypothetical protein [Pinibacter soli]|uniref:Capsule assembly Wzi family protein n=1 Tax=Pinibacter soli TaxID=3044211 RepID=A0ABT6R8Y9_9BACT|nr:hypothetical protein [Pinibacter soli]MDI3318931.1 hypothetical protein [Pinibacter soli]
MQFIKTLFRAAIIISPSIAFAQSSLLPQQTKYQQMLDRLEIKAQKDSVLNFSFVKPQNRKMLVERAELLLKNDSMNDNLKLSDVDRANLQSFFANNIEWVSGDKSVYNSKHPIWNTIYKTKANFFQVDSKDFFLAVNPVLQFQVSKEKNNSESLFLNTRGVSGRGLIAKKIGFDFYLTDNQERTPGFVQKWVDSFHAVPGAGFYKPFKTTAYDYFDGRGSIYFNVTKYINVQFGFDKNFYGNGYRSLFLSDFSNNYLFLKLSTRIWKLDYEMLVNELVPQDKDMNAGNTVVDKKYSTIHRLSMNVTKWLNVGLFDNVVYGRTNSVELAYLNPIIFLRPAESNNGSADNSMIGIDLKANVAKRLQFYSQIMLDEFVLSHVKDQDGWWGNKYGIQAGMKYIDAFGIKNLDIQGEVNAVRPYTYSHYDSVANWTHYNQPLAHPFGANFLEGIGIIRYQPFKKLQIQAKLIAWRQGLDSAGTNYGGNVFKDYNTRPGDFGFNIGSGAKGTGVNGSLWVGYEVLENLLIDGSFMYRKLSVPSYPSYNNNSTMFTLGLRLNMFRREYDY